MSSPTNQVQNPPALRTGATPANLLRAALFRWFTALLVALLLGTSGGLLAWQMFTPGYVAEVELRQSAPVPESEKDFSWPTKMEAIDPAFVELAKERGWSDTAAKLDSSVKVTLSQETEGLPSGLLVSATDERRAGAVILARAGAHGLIQEVRNQRQARLLDLQAALAREISKPLPPPEPQPEPARPPEPGPSEAVAEPKPVFVKNPRWETAEKELLQVRAEHRQALEDLAKAQIDAQPTAGVVTEVEINGIVRTDKETAKINEALKALEEKIQYVARITKLGMDDPEVKKLSPQRDALRQELLARREAIKTALAEKKRGAVPAEAKLRLIGAEELVQRLAEKERSLAEQIRSIPELIAQPVPAPAPKPVPAPTPVPPPPVVRVAQPTNTATCKKLEGAIKQLQAEGIEPSWLKLSEERSFVEPAAVRRQQTSAAVGGGAGFLLGVLLVGFLEFRTRRVRSIRDVAAGLEIPVLAGLPRLAPKITTLGVPGKATAAVDALGEDVLASLEDGPCLLVVTAGGAGAGQTSLAMHLAASLARSWLSTVLIDADGPASTLAKEFGVSEQPGMGEILRGEVDSLDALQATSWTRLWIMPHGNVDAAAQEALRNGAALPLIESLKDQFDCIVVAANAVESGPETALFAAHADAVLLTVAKGVSRLPTVQAARLQLEAAAGPEVWAVVVGAAGEAIDNKETPRSRAAAAIA